MTCPNCGRMSGHKHDRQVFCNECLPLQRELRAVKSSIERMEKEKFKWDKEIDEEKLKSLKSKYRGIKEELEEVKENYA